MKFTVLALTAATASAAKFWAPKKTISMEDWGFGSAPGTGSSQPTNMIQPKVGSGQHSWGGQQSYQQPQQPQYGGYGGQSYGGYGAQGGYSSYGGAYDQGYGGYGAQSYGPAADPYGAVDPYAGALGEPAGASWTADTSMYGQSAEYAENPVYGDDAAGGVEAYGTVGAVEASPALSAPVEAGAAVSQGDLDALAASIQAITQQATALEARIAALEGGASSAGEAAYDGYDFEGEMGSYLPGAPEF